MEKLETIKILVKIKQMLEPLLETEFQNNDNKELFEIKNKVHDCLHKICSHDIVQDTIDIYPDRSKSIIYCIICEKSFH
jgi:hypothetical protein